MTLDKSDHNLFMDRLPNLRERIAIAVLAGLAAWSNPEVSLDAPNAAEIAVEWADALIAELNK